MNLAGSQFMSKFSAFLDLLNTDDILSLDRGNFAMVIQVIVTTPFRSRGLHAGRVRNIEGLPVRNVPADDPVSGNFPGSRGPDLVPS